MQIFNSKGQLLGWYLQSMPLRPGYYFRVAEEPGLSMSQVNDLSPGSPKDTVKINVHHLFVPGTRFYNKTMKELPSEYYIVDDNLPDWFWNNSNAVKFTGFNIKDQRF